MAFDALGSHRGSGSSANLSRQRGHRRRVARNASRRVDGVSCGGIDPGGEPMATVADIRRFMEGTVGKMTPAKAQQLARSLMGGAGKDQVSKAAQDILEWSNKNRQRMTDLV